MNRALEFLIEAHGLMQYWSNHEQARLLVRMAVREVEELHERIAVLEGRIAAPLPAMLVEQRRQSTPAIAP